MSLNTEFQLSINNCHMKLCSKFNLLTKTKNLPKTRIVFKKSLPEVQSDITDSNKHYSYLYRTQ